MSRLHEHGYVYASLHHEVIPVDGDPMKLRLVWHIAGIDKPVCFDKIIVQGSNSFPFDLLMRYVDFKEGDIWRQDGSKSF